MHSAGTCGMVLLITYAAVFPLILTFFASMHKNDFLLHNLSAQTDTMGIIFYVE